MLEILSQHKGSNINLSGVLHTISDVLEHARSANSLDHDGFFRVFHPEYGFILAFSVLEGVIKVHTEATFPAEHW